MWNPAAEAAAAAAATMSGLVLYLMVKAADQPVRIE
jgi:hypothetical protein